MDGMIIMTIEPSVRLSELLGRRYFIEKRFSIDELLKQGIIDEGDISEMRQGVQIYKSIPVV